MTNILPDEFNDKYFAIGVIVVNWAFVEELVNYCTLFFYHLYGGKTITKRIPRTQFTRKITFLTECLNNLPELIKYKDNGIELISRSKDLCEHRDNVIHSAVAGYGLDSILFVKHKYDKSSKELDKPILHSSKYTVTELLSIGKNLQDLAKDWFPYIQEIAKDQSIAEYYTQ